MKNRTAIAKKLLYPPVWLVLLLTAASAVLLILVFRNHWDASAIGYAVYGMAFYSVSVLTLLLIRLFPGWYRNVRRILYDHPLGNRYMTDAAFKVQISLLPSLAINLAYSLFYLISGILYDSRWVGALAVYYLLLSCIRFLLLFHLSRKQDAGMTAAYRSSRMAAVFMMLINLTLPGIVLDMLRSVQIPAPSDILVIASAAYTFYILSASIRDMIVYRKYRSPVLSSAKTIRFTQALVSLLSLEASMLVQFGDAATNRDLMVAITGAGIFMLVFAISIHQILQANREIRKQQNKNGGTP